MANEYHSIRSAASRRLAQPGSRAPSPAPLPFRPDLLQRVERRALRAIGLVEGGQIALLQTLRAQAPTLVAQPQVFLGVRDQRLVLLGHAGDRLQAIVG